MSGLKLKSFEPTETDILRQIRQWMQWHRWFVVRIHQGLGCHKGVSDLVAMKDGRTVWIEVKKPGGVLSEYQKRFRLQVEEAGGVYLVMRGVDDVKAFLAGNYPENSDSCDKITV